MISDDGHDFEPDLVWIEAGGTVTWTNESGSHTATAYHPDFDKPRRIPLAAESWNSGMSSEPGRSFKYTFGEARVYDYFCIPTNIERCLAVYLSGAPTPTINRGCDHPRIACRARRDRSLRS